MTGFRDDLVAAARGPLPIALMICAGLWWHGFDSVAGQAIACILNGALAMLMIWRERPTGGWWGRAFPVLGLALAALAWAMLATMMASGAWPDYASGKVVAYVSGLAALLAGALTATMRRRGAPVLDAVMLCAAASLFWGLLARQDAFGHLYDGWLLMRDGRFTGLIGNANVTSAIAGAVAIFACARLCASGSFGRQAHRSLAIHIPLFLLAIGVVFAAGSRFMSLTLLGVLSLFVGEWMIRHNPGRDRRRLAIVFALIAIVAILLGTQFSEVLRDRFETLARGGAGRMATWTHLLDVAMKQPLTGYGLGSFPMVNAHFLNTPRFAQADWTLNSAHNLPLQWMLQAGLPYVILLVAAAIHGIRQVIRRSGISLKRDDWVIIAILILFLLNAQIDITLDMPAPVGFALFLAGLLWGRAIDRREVRISRPRTKKRNHKRLVRV